MRIAAFDFGSNSIKCLIADVNGTQITELRNIRAQNRLASWLRSGILPDTAIQNTRALLQPILDTCRELGVQKMIAVGTEALRRAGNGTAFTEDIKQKTGLLVRIISQQEEAELSWKGVLSGIQAPHGDICLFDSGGASTEFIIGDIHRITHSLSLPLGAVALSHQYLCHDPLGSDDLDILKSAITKALHLPFSIKGRLIGTGGGVLACAKIALGSENYDPAQLDGYSLSITELQRQLGMYRGSSLAQRQAIPGMEIPRADIIPASAMLFYCILKHLNSDSFLVSTRGLRQGLLLNSHHVLTNDDCEVNT